MSSRAEGKKQKKYAVYEKKIKIKYAKNVPGKRPLRHNGGTREINSSRKTLRFFGHIIRESASSYASSCDDDYTDERT